MYQTSYNTINITNITKKLAYNMIPEKDKELEEKDDNLNDDMSESQDIIEDEEISDVIEIDEEDLKLEFEDELSDQDDEEKSDIVLSKHTIQGKHSLKYDSIFKGKKDDPILEEDSETTMHFNEKFEVDKSSNYWFESIDNENYVKEKRVKEKVYEVLSKHTDISFLNNRRKPSKSDFNNYYYLLRVHLKQESFSNVEIFNELAVYFSDNLFNMFKLLDNKWRNLIISELQDHVGRQPHSTEIRSRNVMEGTEIEFEWVDIDGSIKHITGVVVEVDYDISEYKVDSYENIYVVKLESVIKILNNTKFKYNLNKLNNIDFL